MESFVRSQMNWPTGAAGGDGRTRRGKCAFYVMYLDDNVRVLRNGSKPGSSLVVQVRRYCDCCAAVATSHILRSNCRQLVFCPASSVSVVYQVILFSEACA